MELDYLISQALFSLSGTWIWLDAVFIFFAKYAGYALGAVFLIVIARDFTRWRTRLWELGLALVFSRIVVVEAIRFLWPRERPFVAQDITPLIEHSASSSFPSGHAALFFALATIVYLHNKALGIFFLGASLLISLSRVAAGLHWFSDVVAGALFGIFCGLIAVKLVSWTKQKHPSK